ncbi:MAG: HEAT repeat domain-containing protein [Planctomycetota bacterium]|nr:HEAT repeat domain-containing protein [Planctomycetota bacterium]
MRSAIVRSAFIFVLMQAIVLLEFSIGAGHSTLSTAIAQDAQWIWSAAQERDIPVGTCYFRKTFNVDQPEEGVVEITADDAYELWVNGRQVGEAKNWRVMQSHDISKFLVPGRNAIAVKVTNVESPDAGLAARVLVKSNGGTFVSHPTDATWKTSLKEFSNFFKSNLNDTQWVAARVIGPLGIAKPWNDEVQMADGGASRFKTSREFRVESVAAPEDTGSVIAMAFNEFGEILASVEGGGLVLIRDANQDGIPEKTEPYCDLVKNCQGILPLNGQVFVVGARDKEIGLYRLSSTVDGDKPDKADLLLKFTGEMAEHGPHAPVLGPDGLIYLVIGNHTKVEKEVLATSPYRNAIEGDLLPRYEDPRGHAAGIKAPGGVVLRTDIDGSFVETFAGGLRNSYDIAFNRQGELFTYDSDMEWDKGMAWYRPTRLNHLIPGSESGWRSGWAVWPNYFYDSLPPTAETGRGSPTGMAVYNHVMYPRRYHDAVFLGDWASGRILCARLRADGGSYVSEVETFVEGRPLNVTDLAIGPDGAVYFCTGGRGTQGGVYRVVWNGKVPAAMTDLGQGIEIALRQPQLNSAWARQRCAEVKDSLGTAWDGQLASIINNPNAKPEVRVRAMDLMQLLGPFPDTRQLIRLSSDSNDQIRAKAVYLMGLHSDETTGPRLTRLLRDPNSTVQRYACEALVRSEYRFPAVELLPLLKSQDRFLAFAATKALESLPVEDWKTLILEAENHRVFLQGSLALLSQKPDRATVDAILARNLKILQGFVADPDFLDLLRVTQLALIHGKVEPGDIQELRIKLADEYPTRQPQMNRELVRLLAYLQDSSAKERMLEQLRGDGAQEDKMHLALMASFINDWSTAQKLELLAFFEYAHSLPGGASFTGYVENVSRDFFAKFSDSEKSLVLADGVKWPSSALSVLAKLPPNPGRDTLSQVRQLDLRLVGIDSEPARKLGIGVIAILGRSGDEESMEYLREIFARDPARRGYIAMALAQNPTGKNWDVLLQSLPVVDSVFAQEVLKKLATVDRVPDKPEHTRQVILKGLKLGKEGGALAIPLLEKWTNQKLSSSGDSLEVGLAAWQKWFEETYPNEPPPRLPEESGENRWVQEELLSYLNTPEAGKASAERGATVFVKGQCNRCHRFSDRGDGIGPDLTTVSQRFQKKEILESILHPSQVISDQFASKIVTTADGRSITGIVSVQADGSMIVLQSDGQKVTIEKVQIDEVTADRTSAMPEGLLNTLTLEEIADLFAYMMQPPRSSITSRRSGLR